MSIVRNDGVKWLLTAYSLFNESPKKAYETANKKSYKGIVHRRYRDNDYFRLASVESGHDFFFSVADWLVANGVSDGQYIEEYEPGKVVSVIIKKSRPELFTTTQKDNVSVVEGVSIYYFFLDKAPQLIADKGEEIAALSAQLQPNDDNQYIPLALFKSKVGKTKGNSALLLSLLVFMILGWVLWPNSDGSNALRNAVDPWAEYEDFLSEEASSVYYRLYQDALFQKAEGQSPLMANWKIIKAEHNKNSLTYYFVHSEPTENSPQVAYIRDIKRFSKTPEIQALGESVLRFDNNAVTLSLVGDIRRLKYLKNNSIPDDSMSRYYLLADAIERYVPRAELVYGGKKPRAGGRWNIHTATLHLKGAYLEDIVGAGSLMRDMPVSFGVEGQEGVGTLEVAYKDGAPRLSGSILLTIFGEK